MEMPSNSSRKILCQVLEKWSLYQTCIFGVAEMLVGSWEPFADFTGAAADITSSW